MVNDQRQSWNNCLFNKGGVKLHGIYKRLKRGDHTSFTLALLHLKRANCELDKLLTNLNTY